MDGLDDPGRPLEGDLKPGAGDLERELDRGGCNPGGYGDGRVEADVVAGVFERPSGSLCLISLGISRMEP